MLRLNELKPNKGARKKLKRVGRGHGSGSGQQAGHGHKGQQSRSNGGMPYQGYEGGQKPLYKRIPKLKGFTYDARVNYTVVNIESLAKLKDKSIDLESLKKAGVIRNNAEYLKILGTGEIKNAIKLKTNKISASAKEKIEKAGGSVELVEARPIAKEKK